MNLSAVSYVVVGSREFFTRFAVPTHPTDLYDLPCIHNQVEGHFLPWRFEQQNEHYELIKNHSLVCDDFNITQQLVLSGAGLGLLPASLFRHPSVREQVTFLLKGWIPQNRRMLMLYQDRKHLPLKSQLFIEFIREVQPRIEQALDAD